MSDPSSRDWLPPPDEPDPQRAARATMKPILPKRFYRQAGIEKREGGFALVLDGRPARTPARNALELPTRALAGAVASEWNRQGDFIDPATMPITRIVNSAIDGVAAQREAVIDEIARYAGSDLVCYRAGDPARLVEAQKAAWDPVLAWARADLGAHFFLSEGVMHVAQPDAAIAAVRTAVETIVSPFALAALSVLTSLSGSVLIALAHVAGRLDTEQAWDTAHVDERYQESVWGEDEEAQARRRARHAEFRAASEVFRLSQPAPA
jgi:chaperone required for assembly of F1-ATPase